MTTMNDLYKAKNRFDDAVTHFLGCRDDNPGNSSYTPTFKKTLDDLVSAYERATAELEYRRAQEEEAEARAKLQERETNTKDAKIRFYALNQGLDKESAE